MSDPDTQLDIKKRARRRLIGAIALALTAAIVLPMVMDHEPRPPAQDIVIRIPARDQAEVPALPGVRDSAAVAGALPPAPPDSTAGSTPEPAVKAAPLPTPAPVLPQADTASRVADKPAEKGTDKSAPPFPATPRPADKAADAEARRAANLLEGKPAADTAKPKDAGAAQSGRWMLQLGVFSDPDNVAKLRARMKTAGVDTHTEPVTGADGKARTRVRAGPFSSREEADKAKARLDKAGFKGILAELP